MESWLGKWKLANLEEERRKRVRIGDHTCFQLKMTYFFMHCYIA